MRKFFVLLILSMLINSTLAQDESLSKLRSIIKNESFTVNVLIQTGLRYSLNNSDFQGGRTFEAPNARLSFRGIFDSKFYYRLFFDITPQPALLDAYIGYHYNDALRITAGAMKPRQTLDYIPDPGSTDFIDRTQITGLLVQSREVGVSFEGDIGRCYYFTGIFNGNKLSSNNNNKFYGIGRLQYIIKGANSRQLKLAIQTSHGYSPNVISGSFGPLLRGERTIFGGDLRLEMNNFLVAAEYLAGQLEIDNLLGRTEEISGYYFTVGYELFPETMLLGRWQSWGYREINFRDNQFTLGINQTVTEVASFQVNFDSYFPELADDEYAFSFLMQIQF